MQVQARPIAAPRRRAPHPNPHPAWRTERSPRGPELASWPLSRACARWPPASGAGRRGGTARPRGSRASRRGSAAGRSPAKRAGAGRARRSGPAQWQRGERTAEDARQAENRRCCSFSGWSGTQEIRNALVWRQQKRSPQPRRIQSNHLRPERCRPKLERCWRILGGRPKLLLVRRVEIHCAAHDMGDPAAGKCTVKFITDTIE